MSQSVLNKLMTLCDNEDVITDYDYNNDNNYCATVRTKMYQETQESTVNSYGKWCDEWVKKFSAMTTTNWIVRYTYPSAIKYIYRKIYKCQLNSFGKVKSRKRVGTTRNRDKGCEGTISILFKKINPDTIKNDDYLMVGLNIVIAIKFEHNHNVAVPEAFSYLRMQEDVEKKFLKYFDEGMMPSSARTFHKTSLEAEYEGNDALMQLSNAQINPTERQVNYLYSKWRATYIPPEVQKHNRSISKKARTSSANEESFFDPLGGTETDDESISEKSGNSVMKEDSITESETTRTPFMKEESFLNSMTEDDVEFIAEWNYKQIHLSTEPSQDTKHSLAVQEMMEQFQRVTDVASSSSSLDMTNTIIRLNEVLSSVTTPDQFINMVASLPSSKVEQAVTISRVRRVAPRARTEATLNS